MLSPDDATFLTREPALTGARLLLDPDLVIEVVEKAAAQSWGPVLGVHVEYLRYKPGTSLVAGIVAETPEGPRRAYAVAGSAGGRAKLAKTVDRGRRAPGDFAPRFHEDLLLVAPMSSDRAMRAVTRLLGDPGDVMAGAFTCEILRYRPGRRAVVRVDGPVGPLAVVRGYPARHQSAVPVATPLIRAAGVRVPRLRAARRGGRMLVLQHLEGVPATAAPTDGLLADTGRILARVQGVAPPLAPQAPPGDQGPAQPDGAFGLLRPAAHDVWAEAAVRAVEALVPGCAGLARRTAEAALDDLASLPKMLVVAHGDLSRDQILVRPRRLALLDLDRAGLDRPAADPASWFAADVAAGRSDPTDDPELSLEPMLTSLVSETPIPRRCDVRADLGRALRPLVALALLRRATEPFRLRTDSGDWAAQAAALVEGAAHQAGLRR